MKKYNLLVIVVLISFTISLLGAKPKTSRYEFWWSLGHPFAGMKVKRVYKKATPLYEMADVRMQLDTFSQGGKLDAFRHVYYMAAFAQKVKGKKLIKLGKAHEKTNHLHFKKNKDKGVFVADSMSCVMDLMNNEVGIKLGQDNKTSTLEELKAKAIQLIKDEKAYSLLIDKQGNYLDCSNNVIDLKSYKGKWYVPKCLLGLKQIQSNS